MLLNVSLTSCTNVASTYQAKHKELSCKQCFQSVPVHKVDNKQQRPVARSTAERTSVWDYHNGYVLPCTQWPKKYTLFSTIPTQLS